MSIAGGKAFISCDMARCILTFPWWTIPSLHPLDTCCSDCLCLALFFCCECPLPNVNPGNSSLLPSRLGAKPLSQSPLPPIRGILLGGSSGRNFHLAVVAATLQSGHNHDLRPGVRGWHWERSPQPGVTWPCLQQTNSPAFH